MKLKANKIPLIILVFILFITIALPFIKPIYHQTMNRTFIEKARNEAITANIKIIQLTYDTGFNSSSISVSAGASGVIFRKEGNTYYALTALHVITEEKDVDKTQIVVMGYDDLDIVKDNMGKGVANHYMQYPEVKVEYASEQYDLAVVSFESDQSFNALSVAENNAKFGDKIVAISNPFGERNVITAGRIGWKKSWQYEDTTGKYDYEIITHTALTSQGSSGSALLNEDLEIVGINLGSNENFFRQFISGMAIPNDQIKAFLKEWK
jgi:S1-C subfamily serine protease